MTNEKDTLMTTVRCCIRARDKGIRQLRREYSNYKKQFLPEIQAVIKPVIKNREIKVYSDEKWQLERKIFQYVKNLPLHPMPFRSRSVWVEQTDENYFNIHFKNKQLPRGEDIICYLVVSQKYRSLLAKACGKDNPMLRQVELVEDNQYAKFNVYIKLRIPKPEPYCPKGWVGVDVGWNCLAVSAYVTEDTVTDVTFHRKRFKTRIIQLRHLLREYQRSNRSWKKWNHRLTNVIKNAVGVIAKDIVQKAKKHQAGIAFEDLQFTAYTKRYLIPRYKLKCAIQYLCEQEGIPFKLVNPRNTSITCNKCEHTSADNRNGKTFNCRNCGYEANADFNATVNIAKRAILS